MKVIAFATLGWFIFLITWIVTQGSSIGTPSSADATLIAANERLLQMAQWTITTVLTLGGALIGLNWYQSESRYKHEIQLVEDRLRNNMQQELQQQKEQLDLYAKASLFSLDMSAARTIKDAVGPKDGTANDLGFLERVINYYSSDKIPFLKRGICLVLSEEVTAAGLTIPNNPCTLNRNQLERIKRIATDTEEVAPDVSQHLTRVTIGYEQWHTKHLGELSSNS